MDENGPLIYMIYDDYMMIYTYIVRNPLNQF